MRPDPAPAVAADDHDARSVRRILALARPEWRMLAAGLVFLAVSSAALLAYPTLVKRVVDEALSSGRSAEVDRVALIMMAVLVAQGVTSALRYYCFTFAGERVVAKLRSDLYGKILSQEVAFFDATRTGELISRLASDSTVLQNAVSVNVSMLLRNAAVSIGGIGLLVYTSPGLSLVLLLGLAPLLLAVAAFGRRVRTRSRAVQDAVAEASVIAEETIGGIRTVRAFAQEPRERARYGASMQTVLAASRAKIRDISAFMGAASAVGYAAIVGVVWYGGRQVVGHHMSVGELTSFVLYTLTVAVSVGTLGSLWTDFMAASGASKRIFQLLDREPAIALTGGAAVASLSGRVELKDVEFAYPSRPDVKVMQGVNLTIAPGEVVALVGPSGGGKSTIAGLVARFYDPVSGAVLIDGKDLRTLDATSYRLHFGMVAQDPVLISATIGDNIRYGRPDADLAAVREAARLANAAAFIEAFPDGYETLVGERGIQLSGGQKQRLAIARAALRDPRILVLDEATSALDAESEHLVKEALARLMAGRTTILIAHRLSTVKDAYRIVTVDAGRIVQVGSHDELMRDERGLYRKLVERQHFQG
jgi:ATP-binding cassette subfamily B protein